MKALKPLYALLLLSLMTGALFTACNDTEDGSYVEPITLYEKLQGTWSLRTLQQVDEAGKASGAKYTTMELTQSFDFTTFKLNLQLDESRRPTTFQVSGDAPALFPTNGYWELSNDFYNTDGSPTVMYLYSDASKNQKTGQLTVSSVPGSTAILGLKLTRSAKGKVFISYNYELAPAAK